MRHKHHKYIVFLLIAIIATGQITQYATIIHGVNAQGNWRDTPVLKYREMAIQWIYEDYEKRTSCIIVEPSGDMARVRTYEYLFNKEFLELWIPAREAHYIYIIFDHPPLPSFREEYERINSWLSVNILELRAIVKYQEFPGIHIYRVDKVHNLTQILLTTDEIMEQFPNWEIDSVMDPNRAQSLESLEVGIGNIIRVIKPNNITKPHPPYPKGETGYDWLIPGSSIWVTSDGRLDEVKKWWESDFISDEERRWLGSQKGRTFYWEKNNLGEIGFTIIKTQPHQKIIEIWFLKGQHIVKIYMQGYLEANVDSTKLYITSDSVPKISNVLPLAKMIERKLPASGAVLEIIDPPSDN